MFAQVVEGRLIADLADMETFRMVGPSGEGDYHLTAAITNIVTNTGTTYSLSRDAEGDGRPRGQNQVSVTLDVDLDLADRGGKEVYHGTMSVAASRELEISVEHASDLLTQELIDRAAQRIERVLRKKIPKKK